MGIDKEINNTDLKKALTIVALESAVKKEAKKIKQTLSEGEYTLPDVFVKVSAESITKAADTYYTPTVSIPLIDTLILFAHHAGITREAALKALEKAMTDAVKGNKKVDVLSDKDYEDIAKRVQESLGNIPKKLRSGRVDVKNPHIEIVDNVDGYVSEITAEAS